MVKKRIRVRIDDNNKTEGALRSGCIEIDLFCRVNILDKRMKTWLVPPSSPTGNNRRIELAGFDLWSALIDRVFVYPAKLDIDRLKKSLGRALSIWPIMAGRFLVLGEDHYVIEMSDNPIPVSFVEDTVLTKWPLNSNVAADTFEKPLEPFLDRVDLEKLYDSSTHEPLLRLKLTHIVESDEWILGSSGSHMIGDGASFMKFLNTISRYYQQMEPIEPFPIFERRLWKSDEADQSFLPMMEHLNDCRPIEEIIMKFEEDKFMYDQVNIHFSGAQLGKLRIMAGGDTITIQDALSAYMILTLNTHCYSNNDLRRILHAMTFINIRGVSDSIAPTNLAANPIIIMPSEDFDDPFSLSSIAKTIRRSIIKSRDAKFLESFLATADILRRDMFRDEKMVNLFFFDNGIFVNSQLRYDWANLVDFGYTDKCRFYVDWTFRLFLRVFRPNPVYDGTQWVKRDRDGAEVAFLIEKEVKEQFILAWQRDIDEDFNNLKK